MLSDELASQLRQLARQHHISTASLFHLGFALVLAQLTGREQVVFGTVLFGRMQGGAGIDRVLGMFINTLPVCIRIHDTGVLESIKAIQSQLAELLGDEHASLALAQRCSGVQTPTPLFTAILNYRYSQIDSNETLPELTGIELLAGEERTNYPFTVDVDDLGSGFMLSAQTVKTIDARKITEYLITALQALSQTCPTPPL